MKLLYALIVIVLVVFEGVSFSQTRATTEDGRAVILQKDGTWQLANVSKVPPVTIKGVCQKPERATQGFRPNDNPAVVWFDPQVWRRNKAGDDPTQFAFIDKGGNVVGSISASGFSVPMETIKNTVIEELRKKGPAKVVLEENRIVNGEKVLCLRIEETVEGMPIIMYGYLYTGKNGIVSLQTITPQNLYPKYESEMTEFLNGLVIND